MLTRLLRKHLLLASLSLPSLLIQTRFHLAFDHRVIVSKTLAPKSHGLLIVTSCVLVSLEFAAKKSKAPGLFLVFANTKSTRFVRIMSHEAVCRQPVPGILKEENSCTFYTIFMGIVRQCLKSCSCATKVVFKHALQLSPNLSAKVVSYDQALALQRFCKIEVEVV